MRCLKSCMGARPEVGNPRRFSTCPSCGNSITSLDSKESFSVEHIPSSKPKLSYARKLKDSMQVLEGNITLKRNVGCGLQGQSCSLVTSNMIVMCVNTILLNIILLSSTNLPHSLSISICTCFLVVVHLILIFLLLYEVAPTQET